ncbi:MAG: ribosome biogenesis GTPase Der [Clostridiales bacterium]|nr:ribosome biogenesis GTPase Der [Clostridiales bacterium]
MRKPLVALIGRPNVGKSTFFNTVCGRRISIVKDMPGVTRDRIYGDAEWCGYAFSLVDTGGLDVLNKDDFQSNITRQAELAVELADVVIFMVDGREGLVSADYDVANFLRKYNVPVVLVVNKLDNNEMEKTYEFYSLGIGEPMICSSENNKGIGDILDACVEHFKVKISPEEDANKIKVAIVGKPNAGKSSIVNKLLGETRVMVSNVAGTTRDAIDTPFRYNGNDYLLIDTAGIRRKRSVPNESVELYSVLRAFDAIRRADVVLLVVDAEEGLSEQDVRIAGFIHEEGKPSVVVMNKWDLIEKDTYSMNKFNDKLAEDLKFMSYFIPLYTSALTGTRMNKIMETVEKVYNNSHYRITTSMINEIISNAVAVNEPPLKNGKRCKIYYMTQASVAPPTFIVFVNDKDLMHFSYLRYLENNIRSAVDFSGTPIKIILKSKSEKE